MRVKFNKQYRLQNFDYGANNSYFVTINCKNKVSYLGEIKEGIWIPSLLGKVSEQNWAAIPDHFSFVILDEFQCMPDHFHGILHFNKPNYKAIKQKNKFGPQKENLGSVIRSFKTSITIFAKEKNIAFQWQARFNDRVIRTDDELQNIRNYIKNNPKNWKK